MERKMGSVAGAIGYTLVGAVLFGGAGSLIGMVMASDAGLDGVGTVLITSAVGILLGGVLGVVVFVAGGKALERQSKTSDAPPSPESER